jgi:hypothetical protein
VNEIQKIVYHQNHLHHQNERDHVCSYCYCPPVKQRYFAMEVLATGTKRWYGDISTPYVRCHCSHQLSTVKIKNDVHHDFRSSFRSRYLDTFNHQLESSYAEDRTKQTTVGTFSHNTASLQHHGDSNYRTSSKQQQQ